MRSSVLLVILFGLAAPGCLRSGSDTPSASAIDDSPPQLNPAVQAVSEATIPDPGAGSRIFPPPAAVVVTPPVAGDGSPGQVHLPDGTLLVVAGSATAGLQEAINYAANYGWDLFVQGAVNGYTNGTYHLSAGLRIPPLQGKALRFDNVILDFGPQVTDAGITFDSTMIVDFKLIGEIRAPYAKAGVYFFPHGLVPLDGLRSGVKSQVDSRFHLAKITAKTYGVYFNRELGGIENNSYYFGDIAAPVAMVHPSAPTSSIFESHNEVVAAGAMNLTPFDPLHPVNAVVVMPPVGAVADPGVVLTPEAAPVDVSASVTAGLQEAIDLAAARQVNLIVYGRGLQIKYIVDSLHFPRTGFYFLKRGLRFPTMTDQYVQMYNVTIVTPVNALLESTVGALLYNEPIINGNLPEAAMTITDATHVDFEITGQIYGM